MKYKNTNKLLLLFVKSFDSMKDDINKMYEELKEKWYAKELSEKEKIDIEEFFDIKIKKEEIDNKKADEYVCIYKKVKNIIENILYIKVAGLKVIRENFRVEDIEWKPKIFKDKNWLKYKESVTVDMWEYIGWKFDWEQFFTLDAAMRETERNWQIMLNKKKWKKIMKEIAWFAQGEQSRNAIKKLKIKLCNSRCSIENSFMSKDPDASFWLSRDKSGEANFLRFDEKSWNFVLMDWSYGLSVRCVKK